MAFTCSGLASIPRCVTKYPKNFPARTPKEHFVGLSSYIVVGCRTIALNVLDGFGGRGTEKYEKSVGVARSAAWRSPDGAWTFFFKYQPPPSVLNMFFVRYTREVQRNESESTKGADTLWKSISDHLSLYCRYHVDTLVYDNLTVPSGRYDTWTFLHYITHDQLSGWETINPCGISDLRSAFEDICELVNTKEDEVKLRVFPFTLTKKAKDWLKQLLPGSITTWDDLKSAFLSRYFPISKAHKIRAEIRNFKQGKIAL
ncbi:hypothetical protein OSB04_024251 [Centaurea solstitialis]|uniref:Retrotransposon gag domain-containing protein n=1 Tax=Centaurea solstitialis TaxID=347529 RepID=A0AA38SKR3_9ASTR|nr:hypothetical protein OSB04_024251 [Centaurea solstitialis]